MCGRKFFLFLVVLVLFSWVSLFAERVLTDEQYESIMTALIEAEMQLEKQELELTASNNELMLLKMELTPLRNLVQTQKLELELQKTSFERQRNTQIRQQIEIAMVAFILGNGSGIVLRNNF